jgi:2-haloacid dehalogenase
MDKWQHTKPMTMQTGTTIKAMVFDFGGVLMDWNPRYLYRQFFENDDDKMEAFLTEIGFNAWNLQQDKGRPFAEAIAELCEQFPHHSDLIKAFDEQWEKSIGGPIQTTVEILRTLKQTGHTLYGLSNWSAETFERVRDKYEFFSWFDYILLSGAVKIVKPDPAIFQRLLETIKLNADECLFIDDSVANIEAAKKLGFVTIQFTSAEALAAELKRLGILDQDEG